MARSAKPRYSVGDIVSYTDRQQRIQTGRILRIEANWYGWMGNGEDPAIYYTVGHPTYRGHRFHTNPERIHGLAKSEPRP